MGVGRGCGIWVVKGHKQKGALIERRGELKEGAKKSKRGRKTL
jgi:hypothetical protein